MTLSRQQVYLVKSPLTVKAERSAMMKKTIKHIGVIALIVIIGLISSCSNLWGKSSKNGDDETDDPNCELGHNWNWGTYVSGSGLRKCQRSGCTVMAGIGHTGPGGGIIFYAAEYNFYTGTTAVDENTVKRYYLEAAASDQGALAWADTKVLIDGLSQADVDATDWGIGRGRKNTELIIADGSANGYYTPAATACRNLGAEWFLPSKNELYEVYSQKSVLTVQDSFYLSSSQLDREKAWGLGFGGDGYDDKDNVANVRAIHAF